MRGRRLYIMEGEDMRLVREEVTYETGDDGSKNKVIVKIYEKICKFYENHKKSVAEYQRNNKEIVSKRISARQTERYNTDPEYKQKIKEQQKKYYQQKKQKKSVSE